MYPNEHIPNPFQMLLERLFIIERKVDALSTEKRSVLDETVKDELLTVREAADYLRISTSTLYGLTSKCQVPFMKQGKRLYFKKENLRAWLESSSQQPASEEQRQQQVMKYLRPLRGRR
ncbi:excisionase family DNA binding domain-containing protein [Flammeovirgaceae bacterium 311]|nr:excisionase family DNA binding domain-containing protein [Flammeovirgaceae bacterium 311]